MRLVEPERKEGEEMEKGDLNGGNKGLLTIPIPNSVTLETS